MKKIIIIFFTSLLFKDLKSQIPCHIKNRVLDSTSLFNSIKTRPVTIPYIRELKVECNITNSIKSRLLELLDFKWNIEEIENYLNTKYQKSKEFLSLPSHATSLNLSKENYNRFLLIYDSLWYNMRKFELDLMFKNNYFKTDPSIPKAIGFLDMIEAIPKLKSALREPNYYDTVSIELALARLGDTILQAKHTRNIVYDKSRSDFNWFSSTALNQLDLLIYLNTQESIFKINEFCDTTKYYCKTSHGCNPTLTCIMSVYYVKEVIRNTDFHERFKSIGDFKSAYEVDDEDYFKKALVFCKKWLLDNKGKYQLNRNISVR